tara:strand:+ start:212 stop:436 length:225 start_codon:yes stop_codon:yes gene_type:complete
LHNIPGALQGLLPCFVSVSHCNLNLYLITVFNFLPRCHCWKKEKKEKKRKLKSVLSNTVLKAVPFYFTSVRLIV